MIHNVVVSFSFCHMGDGITKFVYILVKSAVLCCRFRLFWNCMGMVRQEVFNHWLMVLVRNSGRFGCGTDIMRTQITFYG